MASSLVKTFATKFARKLKKHVQFANVHNVKHIKRNIVALCKGNESANPADPANLNRIIVLFFLLLGLCEKLQNFFYNIFLIQVNKGEEKCIFVAFT